jgi:hypothetical protein
VRARPCRAPSTDGAPSIGGAAGAGGAAGHDSPRILARGQELRPAPWDVEHPRAASVAATIDGAYSRIAATGLRHQVKSFSMGRTGRPASSWLSVCA